MSLFAWLDYSEIERGRMMDVIDLFREKDTVDELGLGAIRDAIGNRLFPGTSTVMSRSLLPVGAVDVSIIGNKASAGSQIRAPGAERGA